MVELVGSLDGWVYEVLTVWGVDGIDSLLHRLELRTYIV